MTLYTNTWSKYTNKYTFLYLSVHESDEIIAQVEMQQRPLL